jgi:DNA-binding MarR family transcriptional regulator
VEQRASGNLRLKGRVTQSAQNISADDATGGQGLPPHVSSAAVMASPNFARARALYLELFMSVYDHSPFLVRLLGSAARSVAFLTALRLAALEDPNDASTWLTPGRMQEVAARSRVIRPRTMTDALARLRETGYLASEPMPGDARQRVLRPTEKALDFYRDWVRAHIQSLAALFPEHDYDAGLNGGADFLLAQRRAGARVIAQSAAVLARNPDIMLFIERAAGFMLMAILLRSATDVDGLSTSPISDVAGRFGISRTHIRKVLEAAQAAGLLEIRARGGRAVAVSARLNQSFDRYFADLMSVTDLIYAIAVGRR